MLHQQRLCRASRESPAGPRGRGGGESFSQPAGSPRPASPALQGRPRGRGRRLVQGGCRRGWRPAASVFASRLPPLSASSRGGGWAAGWLGFPLLLLAGPWSRPSRRGSREPGAPKALLNLPRPALQRNLGQAARSPLGPKATGSSKALGLHSRSGDRVL